MKARIGFVSNSSSSSFMVGLPAHLSEEEKKEFLLRKMGVVKGGLFYRAAEEIAECILGAETDLKSIANDECFASVEAFLREDEWKGPFIKKCQDKGLVPYIGSASSNNYYNVGETLFCDIDWNEEEEDFLVKKEAGY